MNANLASPGRRIYVRVTGRKNPQPLPYRTAAILLSARPMSRTEEDARRHRRYAAQLVRLFRAGK